MPPRIEGDDMKFPISKGTRIVRGDQLASREFYNMSTRGKGNVVAQTLILIVELEA